MLRTWSYNLSSIQELVAHNKLALDLPFVASTNCSKLHRIVLQQDNTAENHAFRLVPYTACPMVWQKLFLVTVGLSFSFSFFASIVKEEVDQNRVDLVLRLRV